VLLLVGAVEGPAAVAVLHLLLLLLLLARAVEGLAPVLLQLPLAHAGWAHWHCPELLLGLLH
jgi:hypothetical protein